MVLEYFALAPAGSGIASASVLGHGTATAALGKGLASAGSALVKLAASGKSAAAAVTILPQPVIPVHDAGVLDAGRSMTEASVFSLKGCCSGALSRLAAIGEELGTDIASTAASSFSSLNAAMPLVQSSITTAVAEGALVTAGLYGIMHKLGNVGQQDDDDDLPEDLGVKVFSGAVSLCAIVDTLTIGALIHTWGIPLAIPLRTWAIGGLFLGFPVSYWHWGLKGKRGFRFAFLTELGLVSVSFLWVSWGTSLLCSGTHTSLVVAAPILYYTCFGQVVFIWTFMSSSLCFLVLTTVAAIALARKEQPLQ